jgi:serine/threonine-protein kinase
VKVAAPDLVGRTVLGRYRVVRAIGRGGMGVIYLARSQGAAGFMKPFVIKQAASELAHGGTMMSQLAREARIMSNLNHPGIVSVIDFAAEDGSYMLVLDYVKGYNLGHWRKFVQHEGRTFPPEIALHVVERVLDALDYAHRLTRPDGSPFGIVHRDVSPGNVLLDIDGHVRLADFGVARMTSDHTEATDGLMIKGKLSYMAPELFAHESPTPSSDVYACAVMLHELLVGRNEFKADNVSATAFRVVQHTPSIVSAMRSDVSQELDAVLQRALAKSPDERYGSARELADQLNRLRRMSREQAADELARLVKQDFNDPRMAEFSAPTIRRRSSTRGETPTLKSPPWIGRWTGST